MPIFAYSDVGLYHFTDLLHDLYFDLPGKDLKPLDGKVLLGFRDEEKILCGDHVSEFRLHVHEVRDVEIDGKLDECPNPVQLNKIRYKNKERLVIFEAVHPVRIKCRVEKLHLELNQVV